MYNNHVKALHNFIYYKSGDKELAEDLVQEAFLKLWSHCLKVKIEQARSFLFTVAGNAFLNTIDRKKVALKFVIRSEDKINVENPQYLLEKKEFRKKLELAINNLTEGQKLVFLMNRVDGLKYREIAELLKISQKAVEKRMHSALVKMRKIHNQI